MSTEDLEREPDGIPHVVIGLTALFSVMLAMLLLVILLTGAPNNAVILGLLAIPIVTSGLKRIATRDRDHVHPST